MRGSPAGRELAVAGQGDGAGGRAGVAEVPWAWLSYRPVTLGTVTTGGKSQNVMVTGGAVNSPAAQASAAESAATAFSFVKCAFAVLGAGATAQLLRPSNARSGCAAYCR